MKYYDPKEMAIPDVYKLLVSGVSPRPIALVATLSKDNIPNLAPYSFFNAFGANPPIVAFSPVTRIRNGTQKDTYNNLIETGECTIQMVSYDMVHQINLASTEYPEDINEFEKCGLTPIPSDLVNAPRVQESPFQMECRLFQSVPLSTGPGAGNLMICEVVRFHVAEGVFSDDSIHPKALDLVGRSSGNFYTRVNGDALFEINRPTRIFGMGFDHLPYFLTESHILTANNLALLASAPKIPLASDVSDFFRDNYDSSHQVAAKESRQRFDYYHDRRDYKKMAHAAIRLKFTPENPSDLFLELTVKEALYQGDIDFAWKTAMIIPMKHL